MSNRESVKVVGGDRCAVTLSSASRKLGKMTTAPEAASITIASAARRIAPRATGTLAGSIAPRAEGTTAKVVVGVRYGWPVESGVRPPQPGHQPARPFLATARDATKPAWSRYYEGEVAEVMGTVKGA